MLCRGLGLSLWYCAGLAVLGTLVLLLGLACRRASTPCSSSQSG